MTGKLVASAILLATALFGAALWWFQTRAYYEPVAPDAPEAEILLTTLAGAVEPLSVTTFRGIDANTSPLRYRACFMTDLPLDALAQTAQPYARPTPLGAPGWFDCFDAAAIGAALEDGRAMAFLGQANTPYGIDRVVAILDDGRGFVWPQLNPCGEAAFAGDPVPRGCPPPPERN